MSSKILKVLLFSEVIEGVGNKGVWTTSSTLDLLLEKLEKFLLENLSFIHDRATTSAVPKQQNGTKTFI